MTVGRGRDDSLLEARSRSHKPEASPAGAFEHAGRELVPTSFNLSLMANGVVELLTLILIQDQLVVEVELTTIVREHPNLPHTGLWNVYPAVVLNDKLVTGLMVHAIVGLDAPVEFIGLNPLINWVAVELWELIEPLPTGPLLGNKARLAFRWLWLAVAVTEGISGDDSLLEARTLSLELEASPAGAFEHAGLELV